MRNIPEIIKAAGGPRKLHEHITARGTKFTIDAIYKWPTIGIPDRHWPLLIKLAKATPEELFKANSAARAKTGQAA